MKKRKVWLIHFLVSMLVLSVLCVSPFAVFSQSCLAADSEGEGATAVSSADGEQDEDDEDSSDGEDEENSEEEENGEDEENEGTENSTENDVVTLAIKSISCTKKGVITVKFNTKAVYGETQVTVTDDYGEILNTVVTKQGDSSVKVRASGLVKGCDYTFTISGVKAASSSETEYQKLKTVFTPTLITTSLEAVGNTQKWSTKKLVVTVTCNAKVYTKDAFVSVTDTDGKSYTAKFMSVDGKKIKISITGAEAGKTYQAEIFGAKKKKEANYGSVLMQFKAK